MAFPAVDDADFYNRLYSKLEFSEDVEKKEGIYLEPYQNFVRKFINRNTPYDSLFLYWFLGSGKGTGSISILENFKALVGRENGLERFLILTKNDTLQNVYKKEIIKDPHNHYASAAEVAAVQSGDKETIRRVRAKLAARYEFINYTEFTNLVLGKISTSEFTQQRSRGESRDSFYNFDNRIVVVDEVQNITGNYRYVALMKVLQRSKNVKLILLSATPIVDTVEEMVYISNLLNFKRPHFNLDISHISLDKKGDGQLRTAMKALYRAGELQERVTAAADIRLAADDEEVAVGALPLFTPAGERKLVASLRGKISYYPLDPESYPSVRRMGVPLFPGREGSLTIYPSTMSEYQRSVYGRALAASGESSFYKLPSAACTAVPPPRLLESAADLEEVFNFKPSLQDLTADLPQIATKLATIVALVKKAPGIVFLYSNNVQRAGTRLLAALLRAQGYTAYKAGSPRGAPSFVVYGESLTSAQRTAYERLINSPENRTGQLVKVIIGSPVIAEGVSFFNVRQVHILEPFWNLARTLQAEGRCIRNRSHIALPPAERNVEVYWHVAQTGDSSLTLDEYQYKIAEEKDRLNHSVLRILKEVAIDCYRLQRAGKGKGDYYVDGSMQCDYRECAYPCHGIDEQKIRAFKDVSTYTPATDPRAVRQIKAQIKTLFAQFSSWPASQLEKVLPFSAPNIFYALQEMTENREEFVVQGVRGYLLHKKGAFRFMPTQQEEEKRAPLSSYLTQLSISPPDAAASPASSSRAAETGPKKKGHPGVTQNKVFDIQEFVGARDLPFIGTVDAEGSFRIVSLTDKSSKNARSASRGRVCTFFTLAELNALAALVKLGPFDKKTQVCSSLRTYLQERNLILEM